MEDLMTKTVVIAPLPENITGLHRSYDAGALIAVLDLYPDICGDSGEAWDWVNDERNILLREGDNFGMFELYSPQVFTGHYFFKDARGKAAIGLARKMLSTVFVNHSARLIRGLTPIDNKKALWMTRKLGFTSHGTIDTHNETCELFCLTLDEFFGANNG